MEKLQQITQTETFNLQRVVFNGENRERVENASTSSQPAVAKPLDNIVRVDEPEEDKLQKEIEIVEADRIISTLNNKLQIVSDDRSRTGLVVKILDRESGDVVKQIPPEEFLKIVARLKDTVIGVIVDDNA